MYRILCICLVLLFHVSACDNGTKQESPPNILFIMSDDHTSQAWGIYNSHLDGVVQTPHIKRLRDEGAKLTHVFATNSICTPSRATILTGQYSHNNGVYTLADTLSPEKETLATLLQENGYQTGLIGKWHLKSRPRGFDYYNVLPGQGQYQNPILRDSGNWEEGGKEYKGFSADVITDQSLNWLKERNQDEPFLLMTHFKATHEPFNYPDRFDSLYKNTKMPEPKSLHNFYPEDTGRTFEGQVLEILGRRFEQNSSFYSGDTFSLEGLDRSEARSKIYQKFVKDFLRSGAAIDENIGRLLDYLDRQDLAENTIVIYTADQGYFMGEHGLFDKRMMYEESMRMPFVIRYPKEIEAGITNDDIILNTDFAPMLLDYAGLSAPASMQGRSFRSNIIGETTDDWREAMYYRYWMHQQHRPAHLGIRTKRYKLIYLYGQPLKDIYEEEPTKPAWEFYDLQNDPKELQNLYGDPDYKQEIERLKSQLLKLKQQARDNDQQYPEMQSLINKMNP